MKPMSAIKYTLLLCTLIGCKDEQKPTQDPLTPEDVTVQVRGVDFVELPGGKIIMGREGVDYAEPEVEVQVPPFQLMKTEVTLRHYFACFQDGACEEPSNDEPDCLFFSATSNDLDRPINCVSWNNAQQFARWFGRGARLPTEAEWQFAAAGPERRLYPWGSAAPTCDRLVRSETFELDGNEPSSDCLNLSDLPNYRVQPVCSRPAGNTPSPYVFCDLAGNVAELIEDDFFPTYDCDAPPDPLDYPELCQDGGSIPTDGSAWVHDPLDDWKVGRGGGYLGASRSSYSNYGRAIGGPNWGTAISGFRLARDIPTK